MPGNNFAPFEELKVPVSNSAVFPQKSLEDFGGFGVVRVKVTGRCGFDFFTDRFVKQLIDVAMEMDEQEIDKALLQRVLKVRGETQDRPNSKNDR